MLSSAVYGNGILYSEQKILTEIQLDVICVHMSIFAGPVTNTDFCEIFIICEYFIYKRRYIKDVESKNVW